MPNTRARTHPPIHQRLRARAQACFRAGLFWNNPDFAASPGAKHLEKVIIAANLIVWILCLGLFAVTFISNQFRGKATRELSRAVAFAAKNLQAELRLRRDIFIPALRDGKTSDRIYMLHFIATATKVLEEGRKEGGGSPYYFEPEAIEALFLVLKAIDGDPLVDIPSDGGVKVDLVRPMQRNVRHRTAAC